MQLLRDNLTLWTSDATAGAKPESYLLLRSIFDHRHFDDILFRTAGCVEPLSSIEHLFQCFIHLSFSIRGIRCVEVSFGTDGKKMLPKCKISPRIESANVFFIIEKWFGKFSQTALLLKVCGVSQEFFHFKLSTLMYRRVHRIRSPCIPDQDVEQIHSLTLKLSKTIDAQPHIIMSKQGVFSARYLSPNYDRSEPQAI